MNVPTKSWGTPLQIKEYIVVGNNDEIPQGQKAFVFRQQTSDASVVSEAKWLALINVNMAEVRNLIESRIPGSRVIYVAVSWTSAVRQRQYPTPNQYEYIVKGFRVEAIVENVSAGFTGLEWAGLIMLIAGIAAVIVLLGLFVWVTWRIMVAAEKLGPAATIGTGLLILGGLGLLLLILFGGKIEYKGKKRRVRIGKR